MANRNKVIPTQMINIVEADLVTAVVTALTLGGNVGIGLGVGAGGGAISH